MIETPLRADESLIAAVRAIERSRRRIAAVVDANGRLCGTLTDGDVRRCLLGGGTLDTAVGGAMNPRPLSANVRATEQQVLALMKRGNVLAIPLVDDDARFIRFVHLLDLQGAPADRPDADCFECAVIMAGGEGQRLRPVTERIPKPMIEIGGAPLLERQVRRLVSAGVRRIYLSVNYMAHVIEAHFGDGSAFGAEIAYLREPEKLGTAGALGLLPARPARSMIVMNGDILTTVDFAGLYSFHQSHAAAVTVAAVDYRVNIPYGVIVADGSRVTGLSEKPSQRFLCNAGIYAVSPAVLEAVTPLRRLNMTDLIGEVLARDARVVVFPIHEYWSDIGTPDDLERARSLFAERTQKS